tara:strand:+ start:3912 stop:4283 length:372 start_codon:yes stop_codon:yes gene_type:complete
MAKFVNLTKNGVGTDAIISGTSSAASLGSLSSLTSNKGHVVIGLNVCNTHATASVTVDVALVNATGSPHTLAAYIAKNVVIEAGGNVELVDGKIVIDADTQQLRAFKSGTGTADIIAGILENA